MDHKRGSFSGKIGFVLSAAGASVGLGNIWRFPYLAAKYGGAIFLLVYIILAMTFGYTMIIAETSIGRMTGKSPVGAYKSFSDKPALRVGGWINAIIPILIVPYYSVIGGWVIKYLAEYLMGKAHLVAEDGYFSSFISNGVSSELCFLVFTRCRETAPPPRPLPYPAVQASPKIRRASASPRRRRQGRTRRAPAGRPFHSPRPFP